MMIYIYLKYKLLLAANPRRHNADNSFVPGRLARQNTPAFQADIFVQRLLALPPQVAEAKVCVRQRLSSERGERAVNKKALKLLSIQRRVADYGI